MRAVDIDDLELKTSDDGVPRAVSGGEKIDFAFRKRSDCDGRGHNDRLYLKSLRLIKFFVDADPERKLNESPCRRMDAHALRRSATLRKEQDHQKECFNPPLSAHESATVPIICAAPRAAYNSHAQTLSNLAFAVWTSKFRRFRIS